MESIAQLEELLQIFGLDTAAPAPAIIDKYLEKTLQIKFQRIIVTDAALRDEFLRYHESFVRILKILQATENKPEINWFSSDQLGKFFFNQGVYAMCKDNYLQAGEKFHEAHKINKHNFLLLIYLGIILTIRKNYYAAEKYFSDALKRDPNSADAWFFAAENFYKAGRYRTAIDYFEKAKKLNPTNNEIAFRIKDCREAQLKKTTAPRRDTVLKRIVRYWRDAFKE